MALGARSHAVLLMILREGLLLAGIGAMIGIAAAALSSRLLAHLLFQIKGMDATAFIGAVIAIGLIAVIATFLPARRAAGVDPMVALRHE